MLSVAKYRLRSGSLADWFWRISLIFSLVVFSFATGFGVSYYKIFPYPVIRDANTAFRAIAPPPVLDVDGPAEFKLDVTSPSAKWCAEDRPDELILVVAGSAFLPTLNPTGTLAQLIDRQGAVHHQWKYDPDVWQKLEKVTRVVGVSGPIGPVDVHLFDNGDLLVSYHGTNTFPFAVGLAKFDKDSNLLWNRENLCHHCFSVADDGRIFSPCLEVVESPIELGDANVAIYSNSGRVYRDKVVALDADGNELARVDVLEAMVNSGLTGQFVRNNNTTFETDDPTHLNDVRIIGQEFARQADWLSADDLLISLRNLDCLAILDFKQARIKWISSGAMIGQHSPRAIGDGIVVLDNLGGKMEWGGTQIVKVQLDRGLPSTIFPQQKSDLPDLMRTANSGHLDISPDGQRVLAAVTHAGVIWEIDLSSGKLLWEYIAGAESVPKHRLKVGCAKYVKEPAFLQAKQKGANE